MVKHSSRIYLSQSALRNNVNFIRKKIGPHPVISAVVKANAYGHGIDPFVRMLEKAGVRHFSVASAKEAEEVLECISEPDSRIMVMGILYEEDIPWIIENEIAFFVYDYQRLVKVAALAKEIRKKAIIHLEMETGTNRTGMNISDLGKAITLLKRQKQYLDFEGICTHLGGIENRSNEFKIRPQIARFNDCLKQLNKRKLIPKYRHIACSAGALAYPETHLDMVRVGVSLYGFWPSPDVYYAHLQQTHRTMSNALKRVISWKTDVMDIKSVKTGDFIGYGTAFHAQRDMRVAVIPVGYCNGYPRGLSNRGIVLIRGKKAGIVGLINMNLFMVDVGHLPDVAIGDEVVLLGKQGNAKISVRSFTESIHLLNNEMLSRLPAAIPRKVVR